MKSSHILTALIASGTLAVSLSAQNPHSSSAATPGAKSPSSVGEKSPVATPPATPNRPAYDPNTSTNPNDPKVGTGLTPGAVNSGSGPGGREAVRPDLGSVNDPANPQKRSSVASPQFNTMDANRDGRISQAEFTAPSAGWLRSGASETGNVSGAPGARGPLDRPSPGTMPRSNGGAPNSTAAGNHAELFQQIDTNHDGFLSPSELDTYRAPTSTTR